MNIIPRIRNFKSNRSKIRKENFEEPILKMKITFYYQVRSLRVQKTLGDLVSNTTNDFTRQKKDGSCLMYNTTKGILVSKIKTRLVEQFPPVLSQVQDFDALAKDYTLCCKLAAGNNEAIKFRLPFNAEDNMGVDENKNKEDLFPCMTRCKIPSTLISDNPISCDSSGLLIPNKPYLNSEGLTDGKNIFSFTPSHQPSLPKSLLSQYLIILSALHSHIQLLHNISRYDLSSLVSNNPCKSNRFVHSSGQKRRDNNELSKPTGLTHSFPESHFSNNYNLEESNQPSSQIKPKIIGDPYNDFKNVLQETSIFPYTLLLHGPNCKRLILSRVANSVGFHYMEVSVPSLLSSKSLAITKRNFINLYDEIRSCGPVLIHLMHLGALTVPRKDSHSLRTNTSDPNEPDGEINNNTALNPKTYKSILKWFLLQLLQSHTASTKIFETNGLTRETIIPSSISDDSRIGATSFTSRETTRNNRNMKNDNNLGNRLSSFPIIPVASTQTLSDVSVDVQKMFSSKVYIPSIFSAQSCEAPCSFNHSQKRREFKSTSETFSLLRGKHKLFLEFNKALLQLKYENVWIHDSAPIGIEDAKRRAKLRYYTAVLHSFCNKVDSLRAFRIIFQEFATYTYGKLLSHVTHKSHHHMSSHNNLYRALKWQILSLAQYFYYLNIADALYNIDTFTNIFSVSSTNISSQYFFATLSNPKKHGHPLKDGKGEEDWEENEDLYTLFTQEVTSFLYKYLIDNISTSCSRENTPTNHTEKKSKKECGENSNLEDFLGVKEFNNYHWDYEDYFTYLKNKTHGDFKPDIDADDLSKFEKGFSPSFEKESHSKNSNIASITWEDVGGLEHVKKEVKEIIELPMRHPSIFTAGIKRKAGLLLFGPPGTGKTLVAKAIATECGLNFMSIKGPELLNMYIGESERNVRNIFAKARSIAPCVLFFDELDSLAPARGGGSDSGGVMDRVVSQLLTELDELCISSTDVDSSPASTLSYYDLNEKDKNKRNGYEREQKTGIDKGNKTIVQSSIFVIGATNRPDLLDPSLLRPGRLDSCLYLGISSDHTDRMKMLRAVLRKVPLHQSIPSYFDNILTRLPATFSGADFSSFASNTLMYAVKRKISMIQAQYDAYKSNVKTRESGSLRAIGGNRPSRIKSLSEFISHLKRSELHFEVNVQDVELAIEKAKPSISQFDILKYEKIKKEFSQM